MSNHIRFKKRSGSFSSDDSHPNDPSDKPLEPAVLVYHESARDIVFRDQLRRVTVSRTSSTVSDSDGQVLIKNYQPVITPLKPLELSQSDQFKALHQSIHGETEAEREVIQMLMEERAVVKTVKNGDWTSFLHRFKNAEKVKRGYHGSHADIPPKGGAFRFNSFVTSTSLLPESGKKMRCFGSTKEYTTGIVFALPKAKESEDEAALRTNTWSWPSGYSAKTEFNIDRHGNLINGRKEAIVPLSGLRKNNDDYLHKKNYEIAGKMVKGGLKIVPYNEVYVRVGGVGRIVNGKDCATEEERDDDKGTGRSFDFGLGLPVALFVRTAGYGHLMTLLRTKARLATVLGQSHFRGIPLLLITPEQGTRVLTERLQNEMLKNVSRNLNPFQNPNIAHKTTVNRTEDAQMQQKLEELLDLDADNIKETLTPEERARLAGGFGATDESVATLLMDAMQYTPAEGEESPSLQDIVNEGLASAVRSGDYHTSRQLLILYTLVASKGHREEEKKKHEMKKLESKKKKESMGEEKKESMTALSSLDKISETDEVGSRRLSTHLFTPPPPPPPLDTDRLRSATNSDGLLAVLGAAEVLKSMQDGSAKRRVNEAVLAIEEWIEHGEQSVAFRLASWQNQRAAQTDLKIAVEDDTQFLAFVSNKATTNRKKFAKQLRAMVEATNFEDISFLRSIHNVVSQMHSPCLRLELLQYILGLDNRYSVAHLARSVELAASCLSISGDADADQPAGLLTNS